MKHLYALSALLAVPLLMQGQTKLEPTLSGQNQLFQQATGTTLTVWPNVVEQGENVDIYVNGAPGTFYAPAGISEFWFGQASSMVFSMNELNDISNEEIDANFDVPMSAPTGWYQMYIDNGGIYEFYKENAILVIDASGPAAMVSNSPVWANNDAPVSIDIQTENVTAEIDEIEISLIHSINGTSIEASSISSETINSYTAAFDLDDVETGDYHLIMEADGVGILSLNNAFSVSGLSLPEHGKDNSLDMYPLPAQTELNLVHKDNKTIESLRLYDISGKLIRNVSPNASKYKLQLEGLSAGSYLIQMEVEGEKITRNISIQ